MNLNEISLKWNGFQSNILTNVKDLYQDEGLSDVTLVSDGLCFKAHKVILSACSPLFRGIFQQNPNKDPIIVLHDVNVASLKTLLTFMYSGEVNVTEEFLPILLKAADSLKVRGLSTAAENNVEKKAQSPPKKRKKWDHWAPVDHDKKSNLKKVFTKSSNKVITSVDDDLPVIPKVELLEPVYGDERATELLHCIDSDNSSSPSQTRSPYNIGENIDYDRSLNNSQASGDTVVSKNDDEMLKHVASPCSEVVSNGFEKDARGNEIEKEIENVLQSGAAVESYNISSVKLNSLETQSSEKTSSGAGGSYANPVFPCPFCTRIYNSWGYRRRHVKSRHETTRLPCKWCFTLHPSQAAWYAHTTRTHGVSHEDARNSLVVMVEAHAVLTLDEPSLPALLGQVRIAPAPGNELSAEGSNNRCTKNSVAENVK